MVISVFQCRSDINKSELTQPVFDFVKSMEIIHDRTDRIKVTMDKVLGVDFAKELFLLLERHELSFPAQIHIIVNLVEFGLTNGLPVDHQEESASRLDHGRNVFNGQFGVSGMVGNTI